MYPSVLGQPSTSPRVPPVQRRGGLPAPGLYKRILREIEKPLILQSLSATKGNQIKAAKLLGLNRNTLRKKIVELDIQVVRGLR